MALSRSSTSTRPVSSTREIEKGAWAKLSRVRRARLPFIPPPSPRSPYGTLGLIPLEMRNIIYALVFSAGHPALRVTSKTLHADTEEAIRRHGVYRLNLDDSLYSFGRTWTPSLAYRRKFEMVQNIQIHISPPVDAPYHEHDIVDVYHEFDELSNIMNYLVKPIKRPRSCCVKFTMATYTPFVTQTLEAMKPLRCFERVHVEIYNGAWSVKKGVRRPGWKELYEDDEMVEDVKKFFSEQVPKKSGVTVVQVKKHIRFNR